MTNFYLPSSDHGIQYNVVGKQQKENK